MPRNHYLLPDAPYATYEAYLRGEGASAVLLARREGSEKILATLLESGLRGRGGAGFPTGVKWRTVREHPCPTRSVVMNAAEGEPGTFKDRWLLRHNPYAPLEGLLVAAQLVGAATAYVAIKASFAPELARLRSAIAEMSAAGVCEDVEITLVEGPGEYLFGEEKALLEVIEGNDPLPRESHYPPYELGLFSTPGSPNPAVVNNAETFGHVAGIVRHGAASFRSIGTHDTPGTVIFTISGDVVRPGIFERPAGTTLRTLVLELAGGPKNGPIKVILSGVSNAPIGPDKLDTPCDFGSLSLAGSGLGSAGFVVIGEERSIPRVTQSLTRFLFVESCNQCPACKLGLRTASSALDELFDPGLATPDDFERALYAARSAPQGNRCYLPVQGATLTPALMERFEAEFDAQIAKPDEPTAAYPVPLLVDYDPATHHFTIDDSFARKRPNWTYEAVERPVGERVTLREKKKALLRPTSSAVGVRLAPDVLEALRKSAGDDAADLDRRVNALLRKQLGL